MTAALVQAALQSVEQAKQEAAPLLGTEASRGAPNASGVKNATLRYDLPTPAVAVRNLVSYFALCVSSLLLDATQQAVSQTSMHQMHIKDACSWASLLHICIVAPSEIEYA